MKYYQIYTFYYSIGHSLHDWHYANLRAVQLNEIPATHHWVQITARPVTKADCGMRMNNVLEANKYWIHLLTYLYYVYNAEDPSKLPSFRTSECLQFNPGSVFWLVNLVPAGRLPPIHTSWFYLHEKTSTPSIASMSLSISPSFQKH